MPEIVMAHHVLQALPFFAPVLLITAGLAVLAVRERRRRRRSEAGDRATTGIPRSPAGSS